MIRFVIQVFLVLIFVGMAIPSGAMTNATSTGSVGTVNPQAQESYNRYRVSRERKKILTTPQDPDKNGTDLALRKVSLEVEQQLYAILWNIVFATANTDDAYGPSAVKMFGPELIAQMVTDARGDELGDIAESIYDHLMRERDGN